MKHIRRYNESVEDVVVKMTRSEYDEFFEDRNFESFSRYESSILKKEFDNWEKKYEILHNIGEVPTPTNSHVMLQFGGRIFGTEVHIIKLEDGWYMINTIASDAYNFATRNSRTYESYRKFYKCDQLSGVLKFLSELPHGSLNIL